MFGSGKAKKSKDAPRVEFDPKRQRAVIRCSICTGEQVAGFQDKSSGRFEEVMLIRQAADLRHFKELYGIEEVTKVY